MWQYLRNKIKKTPPQDPEEIVNEEDIIARVEAAGNKITQDYDNGDIYYGQMEGGKRNGYGYGTYTDADGFKYVGEFKNNKYHGYGTYTWTNGNKYVGEWKNSKRDGNGTMTFADGHKYVGEFKNNKQDGQGTRTLSNGTKHVGEWKNGKLVLPRPTSSPFSTPPTRNWEHDRRRFGGGGKHKANTRKTKRRIKRGKRKTKKRRKKHTKILSTMKKRNKLRLNIQKKNCSIKKQKVKKNKFLKNKKKILRLTKKICTAKRHVKKLMNQIEIITFKNNQSFK